jgi:hypothetical protein
MTQLATPMETLRDSGLSYADIERLTWLKYQIRTGKRTDTPIESKRLAFARYLYQHGHIVK